MKKEFEIEGIGKVQVTHNWFTGSFSFKINDQKMKKMSRLTYVLGSGDDKITLYRVGNGFKGFGFILNKVYYSLTKPAPKYVYILAAIPLPMTLVLGNIQALVSAGFYYVGGALGGAIAGLFTGLIIYFGIADLKQWIKILICILCIVATFFTCFGIGNLIVYLAAR